MKPTSDREEIPSDVTLKDSDSQDFVRADASSKDIFIALAACSKPLSAYARAAAPKPH